MEEKRRDITIDVAGDRLGRAASKIATILNGKDSVTYAPNQVPNVLVTVENASKMAIDERKKRQKVYVRYTGYFGGKKEQSLAQLIEKRGYGEVLRRAIYGMLPSNRLRDRKMRRVQINE
ncbi:MAG: 50S ribosomal protein L13 [Candidatus Kaiserbacteria bacterium]|nr:50S ribosomal protein L13 [Candidatus Kaiserbacteria bacterium]